MTPDDVPPPAETSTDAPKENSLFRTLWKLFWTIPKIGLWLSLTPVVLVTGLWSSYAIYFSNLPGDFLRMICAWAFGLGWLGAFLFIRGRLRTFFAYSGSFFLVLGWWVLIPASNDRDWTPDARYMPIATVEGSKVTIDQTNVKVFFTADTPPVEGSADFTSSVFDGPLPKVAALPGNADGD